ncbi:MAG: choice-of-anchor D domain-containing protein, partial [Bacteroidetes bacterium]|nr:choice-of-anchor D domain-containing protein [Bacteroidota bacterium]
TIDCGVYYSDDNKEPKLGYAFVTNSGDAPLVLIEGQGLGPNFRSAQVPWIGIAPRFPGDSLIILPGETKRWGVAFSGKEDRAYIDTLVLLHNACMQAPLEIPVVGRTIVVPEMSWDFPGGAGIPSELDFGTLSCGGEWCTDLILRNPGANASEMTMTIAPSPPFSTSAQGPFTLPAADSLRVPICYRPAAAGQHSQIVEFETETTPPRSIVFLLASDASTHDTLTEGIRFWVQNRSMMQTYVRFIHGDTPDRDETALIGFDASGVDTLLAFSKDSGLVSYPNPDSTTAGAGDLAFALNTAMDYAARHAEGKKLVIAIVNDANPINTADAAALQSRAAQENVTLAIAAVGEYGHATLAPTAGSAGRFDSCFTRASLERFVYETTRSAIETRRDSVLLTGTATEARLEIEPMALDFGRVRVGGDACLPVTLRNTGGATMRLSDIINPAAPFPTSFPDTLAAGESVVVELCFAVSLLGRKDAAAMFVYEGCTDDTLRVAMTAVGYDSVNVGIEGVYRGMPGHVVRIPVRLYGSVPASYDARGYDLTLAYDKTMLYPLDEEIVSEGTATQGMRVSGAWPTLTRGFEATSNIATATYRVMGGTALHSPAATAVLLSPPFLVLHGSAMETPLRVTDFSFLGREPSAGIVGGGTFVADSLCFQEQRLIDASARYNATLLGGWPNPFNSEANIAFALREAAPVRLSVHDRLGREVALLHDGMGDAGMHRVVFDASALPTGVYFYRLESGNERLSGSLLHLK